MVKNETVMRQNKEDWTAKDYLKSWGFHDLAIAPIKKLWSEILLENGFIPRFHISYGARRKEGEPIHYNPKDNWHGVARYCPDQILYKRNYAVHISLQGMLTGHPNTEEQTNVMKNFGVKYIAVYKDEYLLYETFFGNDIPDNIITLLCKS